MRTAALVVVLLLFAPALAAQATSSLEGVVTIDNKPVAGVTITISSPALQATRSTVTDDNGRFRFVDVPVGTYKVTAERSGRTLMTRDADVQLAQPAVVTFSIHRAQATFPSTSPPPPSPTPLPTLSGGERPPFTVVRVHYGTNRTRIASSRFTHDYDARPADLSFGMATVSIPRDHRVGDWETPMHASLARQDLHVMLLTVIPRGRTEFTTALGKAIADAEKPEAFVFVHGYNTSFAEAIQRTALLAYDLEFKGVPIAFSWPSRSSFLRYSADEEAAEISSEPLEAFLELVAQESGAERIHLIAHSMGNRVMLEALKSLKQRNVAPANLANLVLTAPDVNIVRFGQLIPQLRSLSRRTTLYASNKDKALQASRWFHDYDRAGEGGKNIPLFEGIDSVDVTAVDTGLLSHSYHADNSSVISDLYALINENAPPAERKCLAPSGQTGLRYWIFRKACGQ